MNNTDILKEFMEEADTYSFKVNRGKFVLEDYSEHLIALTANKIINILGAEWYTLNNEEEFPGEGPREIGIRVGKKGELIVMMEKIKNYFGLEDGH